MSVSLSAARVASIINALVDGGLAINKLSTLRADGKVTEADVEASFVDWQDDIDTARDNIIERRDRRDRRESDVIRDSA